VSSIFSNHAAGNQLNAKRATHYPCSRAVTRVSFLTPVFTGRVSSHRPCPRPVNTGVILNTVFMGRGHGPWTRPVVHGP